MKVSVIGAGYVGLITGVGLAAAGHSVWLVERRKEVVDSITSGKSHIYEVGLEPMLKKVLANSRLAVTSDLDEAIKKTDATLVCVATPSDTKGNIDLGDIKKVAEQMGAAIRAKGAFHVIIMKSTVIPGTTAFFGKVVEKTSGKRLYSDFGLAMNPEFLREGNAMEDFVNVDRIIIGTDDEKSRKVANGLYGHAKSPIINVNIPTAEMIKYANNAFFALCISFSNEIAEICSLIEGVNPYEVMGGVAHDKRLSYRENGKQNFAGVTGYLVPGCGFGGSCFPKDVKALRQFSLSCGYHPRLVSDLIEINQSRPEEAVIKLKESLGPLSGKTIAILGVAFKPETDDTRESPALRIIDRVLTEGGKVKAYDPKALGNVRKIYGPKISYSGSWKELLRGADAAVLVTKWAEFGRIRPQDFKSLLKLPILIDCRGFYDVESYSRQLDYHILGMKPKKLR